VLYSPASNTGGFLFRDTCVSSTQQIGLFGKREPISTLKNPCCRKYSFKKLVNAHSETMCYILQLLIQMVFFQKIHVFLQISWIGLFGTKCAFGHLENSGLQVLFHSELHSILTGIMC
jgi:hypothetical protein